MGEPHDQLRRTLLLGGAAALLGRPGQSSAAMSDYEKTLYEAAKKEGEVTWYTSQILGETAQRMVTAFNALYPGVKVNLLRASGQVMYQRVMQEMSISTRSGCSCG